MERVRIVDSPWRSKVVVGWFALAEFRISEGVCEGEKLSGRREIVRREWIE